MNSYLNPTAAAAQSNLQDISASRDRALEILTAQSGWKLLEGHLTKQTLKDFATAAGAGFALCRVISGVEGPDQRGFGERKAQYLSAEDGQAVRAFLAANPDFGETLLKDPTILIGEYPHTDPKRGALSGWMPQKVAFVLVSATE
jgi:hypothetical protein